MAWDCVHCGKSNPEMSGETQSLLKPMIFSRTCRYCGQKNAPTRRVVEEFFALQKTHPFDIEGWIEQGSNPGILATPHKSGVCHALVVDWLKHEMAGTVHEFLHPFLVSEDGWLLHGGIIPKRYVDAQSTYQKEKSHLGMNAEKLSEMLSVHKVEQTKIVKRLQQILPQLNQTVTASNASAIEKLANEAKELDKKLKDLEKETEGFKVLLTGFQSVDPDLGGLTGTKLGNFTQVKIKSFETLALALTMACKSTGGGAFYKVDLSKDGSHTIGWMIDSGFRFALMDPNTGLWRSRSPCDPSKFLLALFKLTYGGVFTDDYVGGELTIYKITG